MSQIRDDDQELRPYYQMHVSEVLNATEIAPSKNHNEIKKSFDELTDLKWLIQDLDRDAFAYRHLINTSDARCGYDNGTITIALNPVLKDYFISLAHYTTHKLKWYMTFSSWYSMRLYELLSAYKDGYFVVTIEKFRVLMDCENKYPNTRDMIKKVLNEPIKELESTDMAFEYEVLYAKTKTKGRPPIDRLKFTLKTPQLKKIPSKWKEYSQEHTAVLDELLTWGVSEGNIVKYAKKIGIQGAKSLIQEWRVKEKSNRKIDNKKAYCNKSWIETANNLP